MGNHGAKEGLSRKIMAVNEATLLGKIDSVRREFQVQVSYSIFNIIKHISYISTMKIY